MIIKQNGNSGLLLQILKVSKNGQNRGLDAERSRLREIERERALLSKNTGDPTVSGLQDEKERRSTRSRLRVDSGFVSFDKLQEVGVSPYLSFIPF